MIASILRGLGVWWSRLRRWATKRGLPNRDSRAMMERPPLRLAPVAVHSIHWQTYGVAWPRPPMDGWRPDGPDVQTHKLRAPACAAGHTHVHRGFALSPPASSRSIFFATWARFHWEEIRQIDLLLVLSTANCPRPPSKKKSNKASTQEKTRSYHKPPVNWIDIAILRQGYFIF